MVIKVAPQADSWYNKLENNGVPGGAANTPGRIHSLEECIMDMIPPHASSGNPPSIPATSGVYKITCTTNKKIYVGSGVNLRERRQKHWGNLRQNIHHNPHLQNAWNKYGEQAFTFEVIELVLPMDPTGREQYWLNKLKPFGKKGFNIRRKAESNLGMKRSPESIEKTRQASLSKNLSPETIEKRRQAGRARRASPETREKQRQSHLGHTLSSEHLEKLRQANLGRKHTPESIAKRTETRRRKREQVSP